MRRLFLSQHDLTGRPNYCAMFEEKRRWAGEATLEDRGHATTPSAGHIMAVERVTVVVGPVRIACPPFTVVLIQRASEQVAGDCANVDRNRAFLNGRIERPVSPPVNPVLVMEAVSVARRRARKRVEVVADVHHHAIAELLEVI